MCVQPLFIYNILYCVDYGIWHYAHICMCIRLHIIIKDKYIPHYVDNVCIYICLQFVFYAISLNYIFEKEKHINHFFLLTFVGKCTNISDSVSIPLTVTLPFSLIQ